MRDESELLAKKLLREQDFTHKSCFELIRKVKFKGPGAQQSAITSKARGPNGSAQYAVPGVFCHGDVTGITNKTKDHPELTKYLCAYIKSIGVDEPFSSLCINHGSSVKIHTVSHNKYDSVSFSVGLGDYSEDGIGNHDEGVQGDGVRKKLPNGTMGLGRIMDTKRKLVKFNPKDYLCLEKWEGDRWSITAYTNRACHKLSDEEIGALRKLGFVTQKPICPSSPAHKPRDPDDGLLLFELYESDKSTKCHRKRKQKTSFILLKRICLRMPILSQVFWTTQQTSRLRYRRVVVDLPKDPPVPQMSAPSRLLRSHPQKFCA